MSFEFPFFFFALLEFRVLLCRVLILHRTQKCMQKNWTHTKFFWTTKTLGCPKLPFYVPGVFWKFARGARAVPEVAATRSPAPAHVPEPTSAPAPARPRLEPLAAPRPARRRRSLAGASCLRRRALCRQGPRGDTAAQTP